MKQIIFLIGAMFIIVAASAQSDYIVHTIKDGETLSQLAKQNNSTVGDIMRLNKMTTDSKLSVGQDVKIPTSGDPNVGTHVVGDKETLYSIAKQNNITVAQLQSWNNLSGDIIHEGQILKLGSVSSSGADNSATAAAPATDNNATTVINQEQSNQTNNTNTTVQQTSSDNSANDTKQRADNDASRSTVSESLPQNTDEGLFGPIYQNTSNGTEVTTKGTSGIFKSSSGWQDKKYYILMNDVAPGTVVKVQANGKNIYAKVLWNLGNVKENAGLSYRISDAAASQLNLNGDSFDIIVSYYKAQN